MYALELNSYPLRKYEKMNTFNEASHPAVFNTEPNPNSSSRYVFVPTPRILDILDNQGWEAVSASQAYSNGRS